MASVGALAAIVNIIVLLIVVVVDRVIELVVRNFAASRLRTERRAPVVHDSDTWLLNIPRSVVKYHRHPAILITVIFAVLLIASEIITELGVDVSNTCSPVKEYGNVITSGDASNRFTEVELGTSAFFLQSTTFLNGDLTRVPSGLPRSIKGTECLDCMEPAVYPEIMSGCSITDGKTYEPGQLSVTILTTSGPFKTITDKMTEIGASGAPVTFDKGKGDLTFNGLHWSAFYFYTSEDGNLIYLEYSNQDHLPKLVSAARANENMPSAGPIESSVTAKIVRCTTNQLSAENLRNAVSIYRTIQLENTINPAVFVPEENAFKNLTANDVYRAGLSMKVIDDDLTTGEYFQYTTCGAYKWEFLLPIIVCTACIILLFILSMLVGSGFDPNTIPYNSRSWHRHTQMNRSASTKKKGPLSAARSGYFGSIFDEMVILEEGRGDSMRIGLRSSDGRVAPLAAGSQSVGYVSNGNPDVELDKELAAVVTFGETEYEVPSDPTDGEAPAAITPDGYVPRRWHPSV